MHLSILIPAAQGDTRQGASGRRPLVSHTFSKVLERVRSMDFASVGWTREIIVWERPTVSRSEWSDTGDPAVRFIRGSIGDALSVASGDYIAVQSPLLPPVAGDYHAVLAAAASGAAVVFGSRLLSGSRPSGMPLSEYASLRVVVGAVNALFDMGITDEGSFLKLFHAEVLEQLHLVDRDLETPALLSAKLGRRGIPVAEVPVAYRPMQRSVGALQDVVDRTRALVLLGRQRWGGSGG